MKPIVRKIARAVVAAALLAIPASVGHAAVGPVSAAHASCSGWHTFLTGYDGYGSDVNVEFNDCTQVYDAYTHDGYSHTEVDLTWSPPQAPGGGGYVYATGSANVTTPSVLIVCTDQFDAVMTTTHSNGQIGQAHVHFIACS